MTANEELFDSAVRHQTYLLRFARGLRDRMMKIINRSNDQINDIARSRLSGIRSVETEAQWATVQSAMRRIERIRREAWNEAKALAVVELRQLARSEPENVIARIQAVLPVVTDLKTPAAATVDRALARPVQGRSQRQWLDSLRVADLGYIRSSVTAATTEGAPLMTGLKTSYRRTSNNVTSVARTLTTNTSSVARTETFRENDVLEQEEFISVLDSRTTFECAANDGKIFAVGFGPKPPLHFGCRSIRVSVLPKDMLKDFPLKPETERELVSEYAKENGLGDITSRADLPYGTKGDFDRWAPQRVAGLIGDPAPRVSYTEWLRRQSAEFQRDTLGPTRAALFRKGELSLDRFIDGTGSALSLDELQSRMPNLFNDI